MLIHYMKIKWKCDVETVKMPCIVNTLDMDKNYAHGLRFAIGIDTNIGVIVVSLTTWEDQ